MAERFVILADVHLGLEGPQSDGNVYRDVTFVLERAVERVMRLQPRQVILLGDLVNRGYDEEYARVRRVLDPIIDRCVPVLGNHELQRASIADFERHMRTRAVRTDQICGLPGVILNSGLENLPDTEWHGALDEGQLALVDRAIAVASALPLSIFVHHPVVGTTRHSDHPMLGLTNSAELQTRIDAHHGATVVFSAHTHAQSFVRRGRASYVGAPPLGFWPHAFLVVDVRPAQMDLSTVRLVADPAESPDANAPDPAYRAAREGESSDQSGTIPLEPRRSGA